MYFCCVSGNNTRSFFFNWGDIQLFVESEPGKVKAWCFPKPVVFVHKPNQTVKKSMSNPVSRINVSQVHFCKTTEKLKVSV